MIIIALTLALLISLYWNYQQKNNPQNQKTDIEKVRSDFQKLRLLVNEWNVFKGHKEIKELLKEMRKNEILEEKI